MKGKNSGTKDGLTTIMPTFVRLRQVKSATLGEILSLDITKPSTKGAKHTNNTPTSGVPEKNGLFASWSKIDTQRIRAQIETKTIPWAIEIQHASQPAPGGCLALGEVVDIILPCGRSDRRQRETSTRGLRAHRPDAHRKTGSGTRLDMEAIGGLSRGVAMARQGMMKSCAKYGSSLPQCLPSILECRNHISTYGKGMKDADAGTT